MTSGLENCDMPIRYEALGISAHDLNPTCTKANKKKIQHKQENFILFFPPQTGQSQQSVTSRWQE
jgi:hypothetical protein